jgi:tetratricopeptide (TPR) repeat protein
VVTGYYSRNYDWAIERGQETLQTGAYPGAMHAVLCGCYAQKAEYALALQHCEKAREFDGSPIVGSARLSSTYALAGKRDVAEALLQELVAAQETRYLRHIFLAQASAALGHDEQTLEWLGKAYEQHDPVLVFVKADARFDTLSDHPRFRKLVRRIGLPR